ncbi:MAG TPA: type II toxin-antitoxin system HicB family antitoxin [Trueperaceae bacterium]|nr:type II toxin-antitoxin system HicB family antitoxin [Trueperaceae bacterium]
MSVLKTYKGYSADVEVDFDAGVFHGRVQGLRDVISFQAETIGDVEKAFTEAVDDYLEWCSELGQDPDKPYSGKILVRMPPDVHKAAARRAGVETCSVNALIVTALKSYLNDRGVNEQHGMTV